MSTISISAPAVPSVRATSSASTRLRLTARGRRLLVALAALPLAAGIGFAALSGGSALASGEAVETTDFDTVTVMPGDTLWAIAEDVAPGEDPRTVISEIEKLNALGGGSLQVGQQLAIPAEYAD
ncbi:LysM peptidoglycan-binding domain-containing protein [Microbacterium murale]|uniref:LysM repeat protein n=1 Tax=Microbacterium murale TaxID=1081040 RepID=A0ABU0P484_9MICO|nr:LysM peptidoglycan-binding domain-containing protein [Microbacterium murale]MDQ0642134.1 LysM repeat protein [Microbacterium murale]